MFEEDGRRRHGHRRRGAPRRAPEDRGAAPGVGHEETISTEAALDLDTADPLAEADFHMAYGLYDQAVDLVRMAPAERAAAQ
jgi:hypothetical protein